MAEFAHHLNWLAEAQQALRNPATITAEKRAEFLRLCEGILGQNPTSETTKDVRQHLLSTMSASAETPAVFESPKRADPPDLITGEPVVNIPLKTVSDRLGGYVYEGLVGAEERMKRGGGPENLREILERCSREGPFPGFLDLLTPDDISRLDAADAALVHKCYGQFVRLCLGSKVNDLIAVRDAGMQSHVAPLVGNLRSPEGRAGMAEVMRLWNVNLRENPYRNMYYRTARENPPGGNIGREYALPLVHRNMSHFSIGLMDSGNAPDNAGAGYDAGMRLLLLRDKQRPDFLDALETTHEMTHVWQHNRFLQKFGCDTPEKLARSQALYISPMDTEGTQVNGILEEECEAFAYPIELLIARIGFGNLNVGDTLAQLGIPPDDEKKGRDLHTLMTFAVEYFKKPRGKERFSREYVKAIKAHYTRLGVQLFTYDKDGVPVAAR